MSIQNFPLSLQPIIQQGMLEREFHRGLTSHLAYRAIADRETIPNGVGETVTKTRAGLRPTVTTPLAPNTNTNLDNGMTPQNPFSVEQYTLSIAQFAATNDLNMVTSRVGIASQFLQNAYENGEQSARSLDEIARNALFSPYFGGNTRVKTTLGAAGLTIAVDDVRGFQFVPGFNMSAAQGLSAGQPSPTMVAVSVATPLMVTVGANAYTQVGVSVDMPSTSTTPGGLSGTLTFTTNVTVSDGTAGNTVQAANASAIMRPSARGNTSMLQSSDTLTMGELLDAVATLRANAVPEIDGVYNCYLDPYSGRQLFADPDFRQLFQGATSGNRVFKAGMINDFLGLRFIPTTEAYVQPHPTIPGLNVRRPIICGKGALIEGDFEGQAEADVAPANSIIDIVDGVAMVTREPIDRLQQIIAQSWYWIGGFTAPSDVTTNPMTIPTATNASFKRAVMLEHVG
jgi:hypothetical protein